MSLEMKEEINKQEGVTLREKMAFRILAVMYRMVKPNRHTFQDERDLQFIMTGKEK